MIDTPKKQSGLGIASFVVSLVTAMATAGLFMVAGVLEQSTPGGIDENSTAAMVIGLGLVLSLLGCTLAFALGIAGLCQENRTKSFALFGTILSSLTGLGSGFTVLLGLLVP